MTGGEVPPMVTDTGEGEAGALARLRVLAKVETGDWLTITRAGTPWVETTRGDYVARFGSTLDAEFAVGCVNFVHDLLAAAPVPAVPAEAGEEWTLERLSMSEAEREAMHAAADAAAHAPLAETREAAARAWDEGFEAARRWNAAPMTAAVLGLTPFLDAQGHEVLFAADVRERLALMNSPKIRAALDRVPPLVASAADLHDVDSLAAPVPAVPAEAAHKVQGATPTRTDSATPTSMPTARLPAPLAEKDRQSPRRCSWLHRRHREAPDELRQRIEALHHRRSTWCHECKQVWPCRTIAALSARPGEARDEEGR